MNFDLSEEQRLLKASMERFVAERYGLDNRKKYLAKPEGFERENWRLLAELGVLALNLPEAYGGLGLGAVESLIVMEQLGRGLVVEPYLPSIVLGARLVLLGGSEARKSEWLPRLASGEALLSLAHAEPKARYALSQIAATAERTPAGWSLNGRKSLALHAQSADAVIVAARAAEGVCLFLVPRGAPGLILTPYRTVDGQPAADLDLNGVRLDADALIGAPGQGLELLETVTAEASLALCCEALGAMQAVFDETLAYVKTRQQFGVPIGSFQVIQHRLADCYVAIEEARGLVMKAMLNQHTGRREWLRAAAGAKAFVSEAALKVGHEAIQFHGGMGMTDELIVSHYHKRLLMIQTLFGDADWNWRRYAELARAG